MSDITCSEFLHELFSLKIVVFSPVGNTLALAGYHNDRNNQYLGSPDQLYSSGGYWKCLLPAKIWHKLANARLVFVPLLANSTGEDGSINAKYQH